MLLGFYSPVTATLLNFAETTKLHLRSIC